MKLFSLIFQTLIQMESVFWSTEIVFLNESFILAGGNGFWLLNKPFAFIQSFFLLVDTILEIKCRSSFNEEHHSCSLKPFPRIFVDMLASGNSFFGLVEIEF